MLRPKEYTIHVTHRICCEASPGDVDLVDLLPAVNIILVSAKRSDVYVFNYTAFVCTNFDLIPCCVALTVSPELRFECHGYLGALQAIERKELRANATIFSSSSTCITMQMDRILKYLERGFCWAELGAAVQAREQFSVDAEEPEEYPGTSTLRSYDRMRSRRAEAGACGFRHYDYRVECEAQSDNAEDPVRVSLACPFGAVPGRGCEVRALGLQLCVVAIGLDGFSSSASSWMASRYEREFAFELSVVIAKGA